MAFTFMVFLLTPRHYQSFVATLLIEKLIDGPTLLERINALPIDEDARKRLIQWVEITIEDINEPD